MKLIVTQPFGGYAKGQAITDATVVEKVLASHPRHVVKVATSSAEVSSSSSAASTSTSSSTSSTDDTSSSSTSSK